MRVVYVVILLILGFFSFLVGIPLGYAFDLSTPTIHLASMVGCVGGTIGLVLAGDHLVSPLRRAWRALLGRIRPGSGGDEGANADRGRRAAWIEALAERHGGIALGLADPWVIGGPATALLGVALGLRRGELALGLE